MKEEDIQIIMYTICGALFILIVYMFLLIRVSG